MTKSRIDLSFFTNDRKTEFNPEIVSELLNIHDDVRIGFIDSQIPGNRNCFKETFWEWNFKEIETYFVDDLFDIMLKLFNSKVHILKEIKVRYSLKTKLSIIIYMELGKIPGITFKRKILDFLDEISCEIDIDMYIL